MSEESPNSTQEQEFGPVVGAIIIVGLVALGGAYFFVMQSQKLQNPPPAPNGTSTILYQSTTTEQ